MKAIQSLSEIGEQAILQDAHGFVCQNVLAEDFTYRDREGVLRDFSREGGWWDMRMERRVDPGRIAFPARVVWERAA